MNDTKKNNNTKFVIDKIEAIAAAKKMREAKILIRKYSRKEATLDELNERGINLAMPI